MAISKLTKNLAPKTKEIKYLTRTFPEWRQNLIDLTKVYYPDTYNDFNQSSPGMMFIEMASYVGDVLSYYIDNQYKENLIQYAEEQGNIISIAQSLGYRIKPGGAATTQAEFFQLVPALSSAQNYQPDTRFFLRVAPHMVVSSDDFGSVNFRTTAELNFGDPTDREIIVYGIDSNGQPLTYLVKKKLNITAGDIKTQSFSVAAPSKFLTLALPDENVMEVLSVTDSNGNIWTQVDYLAQDVIFDDTLNLTPTTTGGQSIPPTYILKLKKTARRFTARYNSDFKLELNFGSGVLNDNDESVFLDPSKIASDEYQSRLASTTLDPSDFLNSSSYGLAPSATTLTVTYVVGGGLQSNVPSNTVNKIRSLSISNDKSGFTAAEKTLFDQLSRSIAVNNPFPATGGKGVDSVEEIRQNALAFFNAQNRLVTKEDYGVRPYAMPPKYGAVAKAFVVQDSQINNILAAQSNANTLLASDIVNPNAINLYVLGYNQNKKLTRLNDQTKLNLRAYLDQYRMLTDQINILDGFVVNIGVNFKIVVFKDKNMNEVLARCIDSIRDFFDIDRWQLNQPIILRDLYSQIIQVEGVQSLVNLEIVNKYAFANGSDYENFVYDIPAATDTATGVIYPSLDPCLFELRYPETDIVGSAIQ